MTTQATKDGIGLAALTFLLHLAGNPHYGFFRDELYFIVCGRHPDFGYVDQPPLVPLLAAASQHFGTSLFALRAVPAALAAATAYTVWVLARDMGGGRFAGLLAVICATLAPVLLAFGTLLAPDSTQALLWPLAILFTGRALQHAAGWWLGAGTAFGLAAEGKYSALILAAALLFALAITDRRTFASIRFWQGVLIGAAILAPNAIWQWQHGLPMQQLLENGQHGKNVVLTPAAFLTQQVMLTNPIMVPVWIAGLIWCGCQRSWRWLAITTGALLAIMILLHGKAYYPTPIYPALFAAGGVAIEHMTTRRPRVRLAAATVCLLAGLALLPLAMPVLSESRFLTYHGWLTAIGFRVRAFENQKIPAMGAIFADMHGWQALADQVRDARAALPEPIRAHARVFTANYGEAAAIDVLAGDPAMPPTLSGHNQYWLWGPRDYDGTALIDVGGKLAVDQTICASATLLGQFHAPDIMPYEDGANIILCLGMRPPVSQFWPRLKHVE